MLDGYKKQFMKSTPNEEQFSECLDQVIIDVIDNP
jgi:hypothetical protein